LAPTLPTVGEDRRWRAGDHQAAVVDRFAIVGPPEEHVRRLMALSAAGVDQFNLYLMSGDEEAQLEAYGSTVIPALKAATWT
jgi:alkanesulfonate monooxygenase SsuD/methylene tetrahydromethanopterin reductase-like flavin-dependent oxidoreductase (luciferase family)